MEKPTIISVTHDDGEHSHWALVETETGVKVWSEDPQECKAQGYPVSTPPRQSNGEVSDEEIKDKAKEFAESNEGVEFGLIYAAYLTGAKWMRDHFRQSQGVEKAKSEDNRRCASCGCYIYPAMTLCSECSIHSGKNTSTR